jgi:hypothetical protein
VIVKWIETNYDFDTREAAMSTLRLYQLFVQTRNKQAKYSYAEYSSNSEYFINLGEEEKYISTFYSQVIPFF